jgi:hypothetical protein
MACRFSEVILAPPQHRGRSDGELHQPLAETLDFRRYTFRRWDACGQATWNMSML